MTYDGKIIKTEVVKLDSTEEKIITFEENSAQIEYFYSGKRVMNGSCLNDYYGEMTCITEAIKDAKESCKEYDIKSNSRFEIRISHIVNHQKKKQTGIWNFNNKPRYDNAGYSELISEKIVWSSLKDYFDQDKND